MSDSQPGVEFERSVLGGLIVEGAMLDRVVEIVSVNDFTRPEHRNLYTLLTDMHRRKTPIDSVSVTEAIAGMADLGRVGGLSYVLGLVDGVLSTANLEYYAREVAEYASRRAHRARVEQMVADLSDHTLTSADLHERAANRLAGTGDQRTGDGWVAIGDLAKAKLQHLDDTLHGRVPVRGVYTRFAGLNNIVGRLRPGQLLILAARPAVGKSALMMNICLDVATGCHGIEPHSVGVFSLEMTSDDLVGRTLAADAPVNASHFQSVRSLSGRDWENLSLSADRHAMMPLLIDDGWLKLADLTRRARALRRRCDDFGIPLGLIAVDYLQLIDHPGTNRAQAVAEVTRALKRLAKDLEVPVLALSQLNRAAVFAERPDMSHLRESGAIEQDADVVMFLHRDDEEGVIELIVAKQRSGPTGTIPLRYNGPNLRFEEITP